MKQFIIKLLLFFIVLLFFLVGLVLGHLKLFNNGHYFKLPNKINYLVLGHSHPECAFNDSLISGFSNLCSSGEAYFYSYLKARKIIPNNKQLKAVFIEFENGQIGKRMDDWTWGAENLNYRFPLFFPIMNNKELKFLWEKNSNAILNCPPKSFINEIGYTYINSLFLKRSIKSTNKFGGYKKLLDSLSDSLVINIDNTADSNIIQVYENISETNFIYLNKLVELFKQNNVEVFLVRSPVLSNYIGWENEPILNQILKSKLSNVEYLDFMDFPLDNSCFADFSHLNYKGAKIFSTFFNELIDSGLLQVKNKQEFIDNEISKLQTKNTSTH